MVSGPTGEKPPSIEWGFAERCLPGQERSGDRCEVIDRHDGCALVGVIDGLGHGTAAATAAEKAATVLGHHNDEDVISLMTRCHLALRQTRGAAILLVTYDAPLRSMAWLGVGNVDALVLRHAGNGTRKQRIVMRSGVVGYHLPPLRQGMTAIEPGDLLVAATDGIRSAFSEALPLPGTPWQIAHTIMEHYAKDTDDALVLVARFGAQT